MRIFALPLWRHETIEVVSVLLEQGGDVNIQDNNKDTALELAREGEFDYFNDETERARKEAIKNKALMILQKAGAYLSEA
jgi:hypothetical protein